MPPAVAARAVAPKAAMIAFRVFMYLAFRLAAASDRWGRSDDRPHQQTLEAVEGVAARAAVAAVATLAAVGGVADAVVLLLAAAAGVRAGADHRGARCAVAAGLDADVDGRGTGTAGSAAATATAAASPGAELRNCHAAGGGRQGRGAESSHDCLSSLHFPRLSQVSICLILTAAPSNW